jgi:hypothetical protein
MNKEYRENEAISQSRLKRIISHPLNYKVNKSISGPSLSLGSLVDCMLLTPDELHKNYVFLEKAIEIPDAIKAIWDDYFEDRTLLGNYEIDETLLNSLAINKGYRLTQNDARLNHVLKHIKYFEALVESNGKEIVYSQTQEKAIAFCESIKTNIFTKNILDSVSKTQVEIYFNLPSTEYNLKALLDFIDIDETNKTIQPWDLKSMSGYTSGFKKSVYKYRYDFQAAFYTFALQKMYPAYQILPFKFLVESTDFPGSPLIYVCSEYTMGVGAFGGNVEGKEYKGFLQCLDLLKWHSKNDVWNYTKEQWENNGVIVI